MMLWESKCQGNVKNEYDFLFYLYSFSLTLVDSLDSLAVISSNIFFSIKTFFLGSWYV
jgi:hypothetical protein